MASIVYLIGAGPGDPGLITVRGLHCLAIADVVLYDHLVHPRLLRYARPEAERIDVGVAAPQPLRNILNALVSHGRPPDDAAAIVYDGTLPTQQTFTGSLDQLARSAKESNERRPAILVVGRVAALRDHLRWFDARPLFGKRVLVTRPRDQAAELVERLEAMGAQAIEAPMIRIAPPDDYGPLDEACKRAGMFDWIIFASANAVDAFIQRLLATPHDLRALKSAKLCAVGPATGERLARYGLK